MPVSKIRNIRGIRETDVKLLAFLVSPLVEDNRYSRSSRFIAGQMAWVLIGHGARQGLGAGVNALWQKQESVLHSLFVIKYKLVNYELLPLLNITYLNLC